MGDAPPKPPPPVVGKITHHSIELSWDDALSRLNEMARMSKKGDGRVRVVLQEEDKKTVGMWGTAYTGYSKRTVVDNLEPLTKYRYRLQFRNDFGQSEWSAPVNTATAKEPLTGENLHRAVNRNDLLETERVLDSGDVCIEVPDKYGFTPLMQAAQKGFENVCELLINRGAEVDGKNEAHKTALMLSAYAGRIKIVKLLHGCGGSFEACDKSGSTPLHYAIDGGSQEVVKFMIKKGANVNITDTTSGWTPLLRVAAVTGNADMARLLISHGATIDHKDRDGKTALMIAVVNGHQPLVELLLHHKADIHVKNEYGKTAFEMAQSLERRRIVKTLEDYLERLENPLYRQQLIKTGAIGEPAEVQDTILPPEAPIQNSSTNQSGDRPTLSAH